MRGPGARVSMALSVLRSERRRAPREAAPAPTQAPLRGDAPPSALPVVAAACGEGPGEELCSEARGARRRWQEPAADCVRVEPP